MALAALLWKSGFMMAVGLPQRLRAHSQVARGLEQIDPSLHQPRRRCVPDDVRPILLGRPGGSSNGRPRAPQLLHRLALEVHDARDAERYVGIAPAPQVGQEAVRNARWGLTLLRPASLGAAA